MEQAEELITLFCAYNSVRKCYRIRITWDNQDVISAIEAVQKHFRLEKE